MAAGLGTAGEHALISLLALNGLRVSEAVGADIEHLGQSASVPDVVLTIIAQAATTLQHGRRIQMSYCQDLWIKII